MLKVVTHYILFIIYWKLDHLKLVIKMSAKMIFRPRDTAQYTKKKPYKKLRVKINIIL